MPPSRIALAAIFVAAISLSFPAPSSAESTFIFGRGGDSVGLDPAHEDDGESYKVCDNLYDTLVTYAPDSTEVVPHLAKEWTISEDGLVYTFTLRDDVKFHDGTQVDANAVVFSFARQHDPKHWAHKIGGTWKYWNNMGMSNIVQSIEKLNDFTVRMRLNRPEAPFLANLGMNFCAIVSPTAVRKHGDTFNFNPVGSGPFLFDRWDKNDRIVLKANKSYWKGAPGVDRVIFRVIPDNSARLLALQAGQIHAMDFPNPEEIDTIEADKNLKLLTRPGLNVGYLAMHTKKKPFDDPRVRRAINMAIQKDALIKAIYRDMGVPAKNPLPPPIWGYNDSIEPVAFDHREAKKLLAEAGYPNGFETTLWVMPVPRPYAPNPQKIAQALQANLRVIGVKAELVTYEWGVYLDKTDRGEHDMALLGWSGDNGDPDNFLYILLSKTSAVEPATNIAFYEDDEFHDLVTKAKTTTDQAEREKLYRQAQEIFARDLPWVPLAHAKQILVKRTNVEGLTLHPLQKRNFRTVSISE